MLLYIFDVARGECRQDMCDMLSVIVHDGDVDMHNIDCYQEY